MHVIASPDLPPGQFTLTTQPSDDDGTPTPILRHAPDLAVTPVAGAGGDCYGLLLGTAVDQQAGIVLSGTYRTRDIAPTETADAFIEDVVYRLTGSFLFVSLLHDSARLYLDANGTRSLVFDPERRWAASTAEAMLGHAYYDSFDAALYAESEVRDHGWIAAGLTAHRGIERLICNHYLDCGTWRPVRHWPAAAIASDGDPELLCGAIIDSISRTCAALVASGRLAVALTAGADSRVLLAALRDMTDRVDFFTVDAPTATLDVYTARLLAARFGLNHTVLPCVPADADAQERWRRRVGHGADEFNRVIHPSYAPMRGYDYVVGGLGSESGRPTNWLNSDHDSPITATMIADRLRLPPTPRLIARIDDWLTSFDTSDALFTLNLSYIELKIGSWAYAQSYTDEGLKMIQPFTSRSNFTAMLSLPAAFRRDDGLPAEAIRLRWPELLDVPINSYGDVRDVLSKANHMIRRTIQEPRVVLRKAMQHLVRQ